MKIVVLGGSAHRTPALWSYLVNKAELEGSHVVLLGRNRYRLQAVMRAAHQIGESSQNKLSAVLLDEDQWACMEGAEIVLIQLRKGGYPARMFDETFPLRYGVCGDEGLGPGGLSAGIRNWTAIAPALKQIAQYAPGAKILLMTSPVGLLVRAAKRAFPDLRIAGICELPWTTLLEACRDAGLQTTDVSFDYVGVNHLGWLYKVTTEDRIIQNAVPLKYMRLDYDRQNVLREQCAAGQCRAAELTEASRLAFLVYTSGNREDVQQCVQSRRTPWYEHAVGPLIAALAGHEVRIPFFLSLPNDGFDSDYRDDDVLEYPHTADRLGFKRRPRLRPVPRHMNETVRRYVEYERVATDALFSATIEDVKTALAHHPWVDSRVATGEMAREILTHVEAF